MSDPALRFRNLSRVLLVLFFIAGCADDPSRSTEQDPKSGAGDGDLSPHEENEALMDAGIPLAKGLLSKHGDFYPFGMAMTMEGETRSVAAYDGEESPDYNVIRERLISGFRQGAASGEFKAIAIFTSVMVLSQSGDEQVSAVQVEVEHRDGDSATIFFPFSLEGDEVEFGESFATERENLVFPKDLGSENERSILND